LFQVDSDAAKDDLGHITEYLRWSRREVMGFLTFRDSDIEGVLDWSTFQNYNLPKSCYYLLVEKMRPEQIEPLVRGYKYLIESNRDTSFLFGVKHFDSTLWFVEGESVFLLDLKELQVHNPDSYIQSECYHEFISDLMTGKLVNCHN
jgi:hypothetical protein